MGNRYLHYPDTFPDPDLMPGSYAVKWQSGLRFAYT